MKYMNQPSIGTNASFISRHCPYQKPLKNGPPLYILYCTIVLNCILYNHIILPHRGRRGSLCPALPCPLYKVYIIILPRRGGRGSLCPALPCPLYKVYIIILPHRGGRGSLCPALPCPPPPHPAVT